MSLEEALNNKGKKAKKKEGKGKASQFYRLKPPPKANTTVLVDNEEDQEDIDMDVQKNLKKQIEFITKTSNPKVKDSEPVEPNAPMEKKLQSLTNDIRTKRKHQQKQDRENNGNQNGTTVMKKAKTDKIMQNTESEVENLSLKNDTPQT